MKTLKENVFECNCSLVLSPLCSHGPSCQRVGVLDAEESSYRALKLNQILLPGPIPLFYLCPVSRMVDINGKVWSLLVPCYQPSLAKQQNQSHIKVNCLQNDTLSCLFKCYSFIIASFLIEENENWSQTGELHAQEGIFLQMRFQ